MDRAAPGQRNPGKNWKDPECPNLHHFHQIIASAAASKTTLLDVRQRETKCLLYGTGRAEGSDDSGEDFDHAGEHVVLPSLVGSRGSGPARGALGIPHGTAGSDLGLPHHSMAVHERGSGGSSHQRATNGSEAGQSPGAGPPSRRSSRSSLLVAGTPPRALTRSVTASTGGSRGLFRSLSMAQYGSSEPQGLLAPGSDLLSPRGPQGLGAAALNMPHSTTAGGAPLSARRTSAASIGGVYQQGRAGLARVDLQAYAASLAAGPGTAAGQPPSSSGLTSAASLAHSATPPSSKDALSAADAHLGLSSLEPQRRTQSFHHPGPLPGAPMLSSSPPVPQLALHSLQPRAPSTSLHRAPSAGLLRLRSSSGGDSGDEESEGEESEEEGTQSSGKAREPQGKGAAARPGVNPLHVLLPEEVHDAEQGEDPALARHQAPRTGLPSAVGARKPPVERMLRPPPSPKELLARLKSRFPGGKRPQPHRTTTAPDLAQGKR